jgi:hypothetical protein
MASKTEPMEYSIEKALPVLQNTPLVLAAITRGLPDEWLFVNEGGETWSVFDVLGHLVHGEKTNWIQRLDYILDGQRRPFGTFDRFAQFEESKGKTVGQLLEEFKHLREQNIALLRSRDITAAAYGLTGVHPAFGEVKVSELLATWVAHDLDHIAQIARVMAKQYKEAIGPWVAYLKIVNQQ